MTPPVTTGAGRAGFPEAIRSEWVKITSVPSTVALAGLLAVVFPAFALLVVLTGSLQPDDTILGASVLGGAAVAQMLAATLGSILITAEFRTGTIRATLVACPRRLVVLAAKATVVAAAVFMLSLVGAAGAYAVGTALLDPANHRSGDPFPALIGVAAAMASIAVLGVGIGTVVRHAAGAVAAVIAVVLVPGLVAPMLGGAQRWVGGASLIGVLAKLTQSSDATAETVGSLGPWASLLIVAAYTTATVGAAVWSLRHRDT